MSTNDLAEAVLVFRRLQESKPGITAFDAFLAGWKAHVEHVSPKPARPLSERARMLRRAAVRCAPHIEGGVSVRDAIDNVRASFPELDPSDWDRVREMLEEVL